MIIFILSKNMTLLFFKEHEQNYPILSEIVKGIFCLLPASNSIEGVFSSTGLIHNDRKRLHSKQLEDLTMLSYTKNTFKLFFFKTRNSFEFFLF